MIGGELLSARGGHTKGYQKKAQPASPGYPRTVGCPCRGPWYSAEGRSRPEAREVQTKSTENSRASTATSDGQKGTIKR